MTRPLHLSASAIASFKACPTRFRNAYVLGIRPAEDTEAQRVGANWHRILDIVTRKPGSVCTRCALVAAAEPDCTLCEGTGFLPEDIMDAVVRELNEIYDGNYSDPATMEVERIKLLYSLCGYRWKYEDQPEDVITREQKFDMTLKNPSSDRALPNVLLVGMIDKIVRLPGGGLAIKEHKSTSNSVDSDSSYWGHLNLDTQTTLYLYAARRMQQEGLLAPWGIKENDPPINTILYDVWHKPQISPKKLTQAESKKFVEDGEYCGEKFVVLRPPEEVGGGCRVNGVHTEVEPGKKEGTFTIKETPEMYGARLLADIIERPDFYFRCVELNRTDKEMEEFEYELLNVYRTMQTMIRTEHWYKNEQQCEAKYKCDYIGCCYNGIEPSVDNVPEGMECIFEE